MTTPHTDDTAQHLADAWQALRSADTMDSKATRLERRAGHSRTQSTRSALSEKDRLRSAVDADISESTAEIFRQHESAYRQMALSHFTHCAPQIDEQS